MSDVELERRIATLLRAPTAVRVEVRDHVMSRVREEARVRASTVRHWLTTMRVSQAEKRSRSS